MNESRTYFQQLSSALRSMPLREIADAMDLLAETYRGDHKVFTVGNGGSASTASHLACDLAKGARVLGERPVRVIALTDSTPMITAWANDTDYSNVFVGQLDSLVRPEDLLIAFSGSGRSLNVLRAVEFARSRGAASIGLTGDKGGPLQGLVDICITVPVQSMDQIEDLHLAVAHQMASELRRRILAQSSEAVGAPGRGDGDGRI